MKLLRVALVAVLAACAAQDPGSGQRTAAGAPGGLFPPAQQGFDFPGEPGSRSDLATLLDLFERSTGWTLIAHGLRQEPASIELDLSASRTIAAGDVYAFVEGLLAQHGFALQIASAREPRFLRLRSFQGSEAEAVLSEAPFVQEIDLEPWHAHPAHVIRTLVQLDTPEAFEVARDVKRSLVDEQPQQLIVIEEAGLVALAGRVPWVLAQRELLRFVRPRSPDAATPPSR